MGEAIEREVVEATEFDLTPEEARKRIDSGEVEVIDVRRDYEREAGYLPGSRHIEMNDLESQAASILKDRPVLFYCRVGNRSPMATEAFRTAGWDAFNLAGGIEAWAAAGLPLEPEGGEVAPPRPPSAG